METTVIIQNVRARDLFCGKILTTPFVRFGIFKPKDSQIWFFGFDFIKKCLVLIFKSKSQIF